MYIENGENTNIIDIVPGDRKNIMYIFNDAAFGGAGLSLVDTLTKIKDQINPILIIREDARDEVRSTFDEKGIRCYEISFSTDFVRIGFVNKTGKEADIKQSYEAALRLLPIIKKEKIQLIHINSSVSYFAAIAALMTGIPYVWHVRELMEEHFGCEFINENLKQRLYTYADRVMVISDYVKQQYLKKYQIQTLRIYNGLDVEKYRLDINPDMDFSNVFLAAGMISREKGQWDAIRAVENVIRRGYTDVKLIIVGDRRTSYTWALKKYIKREKLDRNISILPFQRDLSDLRKKASYSLTCSQSEALGRVTIEAMLAGNFVIGAKSGGTIEIIGEKEERGFFYELHNSEALADAMVRAMQCLKETKMQMMKEAQAYAETVFDSGQYCEKLMDVYNEVISSYKPKNPVGLLDELKEQYEFTKNTGRPGSHEHDTRYQKAQAAFTLAIKWLEVRQSGHNLGEYFKENNIRSIAIYGMADLGCRLYDELENEDVEIKYLLDRNPGGMDQIFDFVSLDGEKMDVDAVVVTVAGAERQIVKDIKGKGYQKVIGLSEILEDRSKRKDIRI